MGTIFKYLRNGRFSMDEKEKEIYEKPELVKEGDLKDITAGDTGVPE